MTAEVEDLDLDAWREELRLARRSRPVLPRFGVRVIEGVRLRFVERLPESDIRDADLGWSRWPT